MSARSLRLHPTDNVALALTELTKGERVDDIVLHENVPVGHKFSVCDVAPGDALRKYANLIAVATKPIRAGEHVHVHNAVIPEKLGTRGPGKEARRANISEPRSFMGFRRGDGTIATRNYIGILTTVNCSATVARAIAARFAGPALAGFPGVDGVIALTHAHGCAMARDSEGIKTLRRTLAGYARHPNFAGVLMIGLGCESNELSAVLEECGGPSTRLHSLDIQASGGTLETIEAGVKLVEELLQTASGLTRETLPVSHLSLGLQCGGSDAFSGISANPALGAAADLLVAHGGTAILSETPEIYGAEHLLLSRADSPQVAQALQARVDWWGAHVRAHGGTLNDNPSAGNIAGGITTILEKSLGAVAKAGASPLSAVYEYAQPIRDKGLVFMDSPGFDPVSATGQVASGANLIAFTTGRGSTFGCKPVPSLKLATNTALFERMRGDMDINCGSIVDGNATIADKGREIFEALIEMASGTPSASEKLGFGEAEFAPWVPGAVT
jgi:altronate hydrolase